jgi:molybdopterin molybdotransferase
MDLLDAKKVARDLAVPLAPETVALDLALGRVLAADIAASGPIPPEPRSKWDGFAVRSADLAGAGPGSPVRLKVQPGAIPAGHLPEYVLESGECVRIMTGAPIPEGADAVIRFEDAAGEASEAAFHRVCAPGEGTSAQGSDIRTGEKLLAKGDVLTPARLALGAALGLDQVAVYRRPQVAVLGTGDELREIGAAPGGAGTFANNVHLLAWLGALQGAEPVLLGIAPDDPEAIAARIGKTRASLVITTGGLGQGSKDFSRQVWENLGISSVFREIGLSPGRGSALGTRERQIFAGVPGNPWAARIVFEEILAPVLWSFQGAGKMSPPLFRVRLAAPLKKRPGGYQAVDGRLDWTAGEGVFIPLPFAGGGSKLLQVRESFAYVILPPRVVEIEAGDMVEVRMHGLPFLAAALFGA